jgi:hypothetical protein
LQPVYVLNKPLALVKYARAAIILGVVSEKHCFLFHAPATARRYTQQTLTTARPAARSCTQR